MQSFSPLRFLALEEMHRDGEEGRKKITTITRYATVGLALFESVCRVAIGFRTRNIIPDMSIVTERYCGSGNSDCRFSVTPLCGLVRELRKEESETVSHCT